MPHICFPISQECEEKSNNCCVKTFYGHFPICILMWNTVKLYQNGTNDNDCAGRRRPSSCRYYAGRRTGILSIYLLISIFTTPTYSLHLRLQISRSHFTNIEIAHFKSNHKLYPYFRLFPYFIHLFYNIICYGGSQSGCNVLEYQNQAKMLFRKLGPQSPIRCSIETGPYLFQWVSMLVIFSFYFNLLCFYFTIYMSWITVVLTWNSKRRMKLLYLSFHIK